MSPGRSLDGRHALITGGGSGIGAAIAHSLAAAGARVSLIGRRAAPLEEVAGQLADAIAISADVSSPESVTAAFGAARAAFGPLSILVNNAGIAPSAPFAKTSTDQWDEVLRINLSGAFYCAREAVGDLLQAGGGRLINIASTAGLKGYGYVAHYCAAKHGLIGLTRALAAEYALKDITVNAVCPGYTDTGIVARTVDNIVDKTGRSADQAIADLVRGNPQGRLIDPPEVASTVLWLCGAEARSITGQAIAVAGGEVT